MSRRFDCRAFDAPLTEPLATADGRIDARSGWLVAVRDGDETLGVGEATPLAGWSESAAACERALADADADRGVTTRPACPAASHGLTVAVADALARRAGDSLATVLARNEPRTRVPVNATIGDGSVADTVAAAERAVEAGYRTLKLKIGAREPATDVRRTERVVASVPDEVSVRVDANGAYDRATARRVVADLADLVAYVEQPVSGEQLADLAALRNVGPPIAADESVVRFGPKAVLAADAADVLVCKPMALGGPFQTLAAARTAAARGVATVVTTTIDAVIARVAAVHVAAAVPSPAPDRRPLAHGLATGDKLAREPLGVTDELAGGDATITVPTTPGLAGDRLDWPE